MTGTSTDSVPQHTEAAVPALRTRCSGMNWRPNKSRPDIPTANSARSFLPYFTSEQCPNLASLPTLMLAVFPSSFSRAKRVPSRALSHSLNHLQCFTQRDQADSLLTAMLPIASIPRDRRHLKAHDHTTHRHHTQPPGTQSEVFTDLRLAPSYGYFALRLSSLIVVVGDKSRGAFAKPPCSSYKELALTMKPAGNNQYVWRGKVEFLNRHLFVSRGEPLSLKPELDSSPKTGSPHSLYSLGPWRWTG
ncbi:hypothetical protein BaRGS_00020090, partial [Batillaria attramentaria]